MKRAMSELEKIDIFKLDISPRLRNVLSRNGILDLRETGKYTKYDFISFLVNNKRYYESHYYLS